MAPPIHTVREDQNAAARTREESPGISATKPLERTHTRAHSSPWDLVPLRSMSRPSAVRSGPSRGPRFTQYPDSGGPEKGMRTSEEPA